jgi:hypothetical protein
MGSGPWRGLAAGGGPLTMKRRGDLLEQVLHSRVSPVEITRNPIERSVLHGDFRS